MVIKNNIAAFTALLAPYGARLVAVSKTHPVDKIKEAYACGQRLFGENKVQEMQEKHAQLPDDIEWHLIGHLQRNKVKYVAPFVALIHSVDSLPLLLEINKQGEKINRVIHCLLQVFIASEETKFGLDAGELMDLVRSPQIKNLTHIQIDGLMGMASFTQNKEQIRNEFRTLKKLFDDIRLLSLQSNIQMKELSIGMSSDYTLALEEGSTLVRVGTALFGERNSHDLK